MKGYLGCEGKLLLCTQRDISSTLNDPQKKDNGHSKKHSVRLRGQNFGVTLGYWASDLSPSKCFWKPVSRPTHWPSVTAGFPFKILGGIGFDFPLWQRCLLALSGDSNMLKITSQKFLPGWNGQDRHQLPKESQWSVEGIAYIASKVKQLACCSQPCEVKCW